MKYLTLILISLTLMACQRAETQNVSHEFVIPDELKDCEIIRLTPESMVSDTVYVLDCPDGYKGTSTQIYEGKQHSTNSIHLAP